MARDWTPPHSYESRKTPKATAARCRGWPGKIWHTSRAETASGIIAGPRVGPASRQLCAVPPSGQITASSYAFAVFILAIGMVFVVGPAILHGRIPGDLADGRLNNYFLEHFYHWTIGKSPDFWNAKIFYPWPLTMALSDTHLGDGIVYAALRIVGLSREDAYRWWYIVGFLLNFVAATYALIRLGYSVPAASLGAFLFTFAMPMTAQEGHVQLLYRFGVPLAVLSLLQIAESQVLLRLGFVLFWTTWQFYCSIYIGYFLSLLLTTLTVAQLLCRERGSIVSIARLPHETLRAWHAESPRARLSFVVVIVAMAGLLGMLFAPYVNATKLYRLSRSWDDIAPMVPRWKSYFFTDVSLIWPATVDGIPDWWEQAMFVGIAPYLAMAAAGLLRLRRRASTDRRFAPVVIGLSLLMLLTLWLPGHSLYHPIAMLPGANAIRAVSRVILVMMFPLGLLFASSLDAIHLARLRTAIRIPLLCSLALLLVAEATLVRHYVSTKAEWRARMRAVQALMPKKLPANPILLLAPKPGEPWYYRAMDAMIFAQDHEWPVINGYSGNSPPDYRTPVSCAQGFADLAKGLAALNRSEEYSSLARHVLVVGYPPGCQTAVPSH